MEKDSREKLIEAATPLFAQKGFAAVSIRELATAAGINSALISYHFGGKEGLYAAVLEHQFSRIGRILEKVMEARLQPLERVEMYARLLAATHKEKPFLLRFAQSELVNPTGCFEVIIKKYISQVFQFLYLTIMEGIGQGKFRKDLNPVYSVMTLAGMLNFYFIAKPLARSILPDIDKSDEEYVIHAVKIYLDGIKEN